MMGEDQTAGLPSVERSLPIAPDCQLHLRLIPDPRRPDLPALDARLFRRSPADVSPDGFMPTKAGFQLPARFIPELIRLLELLKQRAGEAMLWAPPQG